MHACARDGVEAIAIRESVDVNTGSVGLLLQGSAAAGLRCGWVVALLRARVRILLMLLTREAGCCGREAPCCANKKLHTYLRMYGEELTWILPETQAVRRAVGG